METINDTGGCFGSISYYFNVGNTFTNDHSSDVFSSVKEREMWELQVDRLLA